MNQNISFYTILGINSDSSEDEIKRAYFKKLREYPPEKAPDEYKKIVDAYKTLSAPEKRRQYDSISKYGDKISNLFSDGLQQIDDGNWSNAVNIFKNILVLDENSLMARYFMSICFLNSGEYQESVKHLSHLIEKQNSKEFYTTIGHAYRRWYIETESNDLTLLQKAEKSFKISIEENKQDTDAMVGLFDLYLWQKKYNDALLWIDSAIMADGTVDITDFDFFYKKIELLIIKRDYKQIEITFGILKSLIQNEEIGKYVFSRFVLPAANYFDSKLYDVAEIYLQMAISLNLEINSEITQFYEEAKRMRGLYTQLNNLYGSYNIEKVFIALVQLWMADDLRESERNKYFDDIIEAINSYIYNGVQYKLKDSLSKLASQYGLVYELNPEFLNNVYKTIDKYGSLPRPNKNVSPLMNLGIIYWPCGHRKESNQINCNICGDKTFSIAIGNSIFHNDAAGKSNKCNHAFDYRNICSNCGCSKTFIDHFGS